MSDIRDRLAEKARRAEELRSEIRSQQYATQDALAEADLVIQEQAMDAELERLEAERRAVVVAGGGTVADALRAMEEQAAVTVTPAPPRPPLGVSAGSNTESADAGEKE